MGTSRGENTRGMEKCEKITIKDEPVANAIQMWIVDVATTAKMAYGFDSNYAYAMVAGVMSHDERTLDEPLRYNHLENALFVGLKGAITTVALLSDVRVRMMGGRPLTALRLMKTMIEYFRVPEENEDMLHANALASLRLNTSPHVEEGQALHEFFSKWEMQCANYMGIATRSQTDSALINNLFLMVKDLRILSHDVEAWRSLKASERTTKWLKDKIRYRIEIWRAEKNCAKAANAAFESAVAPGYSALPAEGKGSGAYRTTPDIACRERKREIVLPGSRPGRGLSISADVRKKIGTPDDPKTRFGSRSPHGKRRVCYPYMRGQCPKTAEECDYSHDIFLYDDAQKIVESKGFCGWFFRYGKCRAHEDGRCNFLHERPTGDLHDEFARVDVPQTVARAESPHPEARGSVLA